MSREYNNAAAIYKAFDIENLKKPEPEKERGLLGKPKSKETGMDYSQPAVRAGMQQAVIRKYRDELKNGSV